jgi:mitogen-activated protein kinase kinase kinase
MAPEVVSKQEYTPQSDIWSIGCTIVEMVTAQHPWSNLNQFQALFSIGSGARPPIPENISPELSSLLDDCFQKLPGDRPSALSLLEREFFQV